MPVKTIPRRVRPEWAEGDQRGFVTKSFTRDDGTQYHPVLDVETGEFFCDCMHHEIRHAFCKHLRKAAVGLIRKGELPTNFLLRYAKACCMVCYGTHDLFPICMEDGSPIHGVWLCRECAAQKREGI